MFRAVMVLHAHDREALDRVFAVMQQSLRLAGGRGERWDAMGSVSVETPAFCAREAAVFRAAGEGRGHAAADVAGHEAQLPRPVNQ